MSGMLRTCRWCREKFDPTLPMPRLCTAHEGACQPVLRGFAAMPREKVAEIASQGGKVAQTNGNAHRFTREEAVEAGRKGGLSPHRIRGSQKKPKVVDEPGG